MHFIKIIIYHIPRLSPIFNTCLLKILSEYYIIILYRVAPQSWESASGLNVSQTSALNLGGSYEVKMGTISIGIGLLEVCEGSKHVAD